MSGKSVTISVNNKRVPITKKELKLIYEIIELEKQNLEASRIIQDSEQPSAYENTLNNLTKKLATA